MNNFKNMKIEVNAEQPLEEIVRELEKKGYIQADSVKNPKFIVTYDYGYFVSCGFTESKHKLTTLSELKEM